MAEDWAPLGQPLPEILTLPPPISLEDEDEDDYLKRQQSEIDRLKNRNRNLEEDLRKFADTRSEHKQVGMPRQSVALSALSMP